MRRRHDCPSARDEAGRPFLVAGALRTADPVCISGWCGPAHRGPGPTCSPRVRQAVAEHYARTALMEHASVASFARFVLQLLAIGAPPPLILDAQQAMHDEVRHAQACFAIARAYGGHTLGPGPLGIDGALAGPHDTLSIARSVIREGCIGETLAALEVEHAATWARDAALARTLSQIAEDELAHARLAWRVVAWLLRRADADEAACIGKALWAAIADARGSTRGSPHHDLDPVVLRAHGVLCADDRAASRTRALDTVIEPSAAALLAPGRGTRRAEAHLL